MLAAHYITSKNTFKNVSGIQDVIIYVGHPDRCGSVAPSKVATLPSVPKLLHYSTLFLDN